MEKQNFSAFRQTAKQRLGNAQYDPKKLVLIHTGAFAGAMVVILFAQHILQGQIEQTGGLGGMGLRGILATASSSLSFLVNLAMPFWSMGYLFAALKLAREEQAVPATLLEGFRRFGGVLRLALTRSLIYLGIAMLSFYPSAMIYVLTPLSDPLLRAVQPFLTETGLVDQTALLQMTEEAQNAIVMGMVPFAVLFGLLFAAVAVPLFYQLRMADYALMDDPKTGAFAALRKSRQMMKGNRLALFRLDLQFWWYYLLELVTIGICYADVLLPMLGIALPFSAEVCFYGSYLCYLVAQLALYWWTKNPVAVTYALVYDSLKPEEAPELPENNGWQY